MLEDLILWQLISAIINSVGFIITALGFLWVAVKLTDKVDKK